LIGGSACATRLEKLLAPAFFKALSDPNRVALLQRLATLDRPCTVTEAAGCCPVDMSVVSRHLTTLREAGIVTAEKRGREVLYSVRYDAVVSALRGLADAIEGCCPSVAAETAAQPDYPTPPQG
jgi:DNA-binding transcriptional ArsR family regulator